MTAIHQPPRIGGYRVLGPLGEGGMGVVHLAEDPSGRRVALKVLRPHVVGDEQARRRFAQEVSSLSRVTSDRVAGILDADPWGPQPYVVTRLIEGPSLTERVRAQGPLGEPALRRFAAGLAEALAAVHRVGVLHRDVKPGNVLLEGPSEAPDAVLIDFGLARMNEDPHLTGTGWLLGTPGYLAPEILYGDEPTPAADVHAWAATVVFAATGRPPAGRGPTMAVLDRVRRGEIDLTDVPPRLRPLLEQALAPEPEDRPGLSAVLAALGAQQPPAPAAEPTVVLPQLGRTEEPTRVLSTDPGWPDDGAAGWDAAPWEAPPDPPRRARQRLGLLGLGLALVGAVALAPYVGLAVLLALALLLRFVSTTTRRHRRRREIRGHGRWYDIPASALASPAYLLASLAGTLLLAAWLAALLAALAVLLSGLQVGVTTGLLVAGAASVLSLWWGPGSARVRDGGRWMTSRWTRRTRTGLVWAAGGAVVGVVLLALLAAQGPSWTPAPAAPWSSGWVAQVRDRLP